ncbi:hypothetical protein BIU88_00575 [Chlorobaculum limnaeum]|uniref:Uncharacterized protein n=1 Tax=Chlorobaculum limnaeum TaxID=274537 RepID=A0A1D8CY88_CHLLM|nr:hypothetical protein BIU88_00575 [Chlorobaculum limnaeum]
MHRILAQLVWFNGAPEVAAINYSPEFIVKYCDNFIYWRGEHQSNCTHDGLDARKQEEWLRQKAEIFKNL